MGLIRFLIFLLVAWLLYTLVKRYINNTSKKDPSEKSGGKDKVEKVVKCAKCSVHIPVREAIEHKGRYYCSEQHLQNQDDA